MGIYEDAPVEQREEIIAQLDMFARSSKAELASSVGAEKREVKRLKTGNGEKVEPGDIVSSGEESFTRDWGVVVCLQSAKEPLSKELTAQRHHEAASGLAC